VVVAVKPVGVVGAAPSGRDARGVERVVDRAQCSGDEEVLELFLGGILGVGAIEAARTERAARGGGHEVAAKRVAGGAETAAGGDTLEVVVAVAVGWSARSYER
jgi:hypothetical protein